MRSRIIYILGLILLASCGRGKVYENEESTALTATLPEVFESFYYSNYCKWVENELSAFYDTIPFDEDDNSSELIFRELVKEKCNIIHNVEFDGYLISLPKVIKEKVWLINVFDTNDLEYFDLTTTKKFQNLDARFIGFQNLSLNEKYIIKPVCFEGTYSQENFKFRPEISSVSFNESFTRGFYFISIWKDGGYQITGTSTLVLIEKKENVWRVKEIKYFRKG